MSISKTQSQETDIILNKANVALARSQRLVASWLPAPSAEEKTTNLKSEEELQREEEEIFKAVPETYVFPFFYSSLFIFILIYLFYFIYLFIYFLFFLKDCTNRQMNE